jgi:hypothetical protein
MEYTNEQNNKIAQVIEKLSGGNTDVKNSPSTKVMAINLLTAMNWDVSKVFESLR